MHVTYNFGLLACWSIAQQWRCKDASLDDHGFRGNSHAELSNIVTLPMFQNLRRSVNVNQRLLAREKVLTSRP